MLPIGFLFRQVLRKELPKMVPYFRPYCSKKSSKNFLCQKVNWSFQKSGIIFASIQDFFVIFNPFEQAIFPLNWKKNISTVGNASSHNFWENFAYFFAKFEVFLVACPYRRTPLCTIFPKNGCPYTSETVRRVTMVYFFSFVWIFRSNF